MIKIHPIPVLSFTLLCYCVNVSAQKKTETKPLKDFPVIIQCNPDQFLSCFDVKEGGSVTITCSDQFVFKGTVVSNIKRYENLYSVMIRSENFENTLFQISRQIAEDKSYRFVGRMMSPDSPVGYKITPDEKGNYLLEQFETTHILQDCFPAQ